MTESPSPLRPGPDVGQGVAGPLHLLGRLPTMAWLARADGKRTHFSRRWTEFTGRTLGQERGDGWLDGVHPEDRARVAALIARGLPEDREHLLEYRLRRRDGQWREILDISVPVRSANGELEAWVGTCRDVTHHRRRQREKRDSEIHFDTIFYEAPIGMALVSTEGYLVRANPALCEVLGRSMEEVQGRSLYELQKPDVAIACRALLAQAARSEGRIVEQRWHLLHRDGREIPVLVSAALVRDAEDLPAHWIAQIQDLTAREEAERALRQTEDRLRQAQKMEALGRLADGISHDFNNLLFVIHGYAARLAEHMAGNDPRQESLAQIVGAAERATDLAAHLQRLGRGRTHQLAQVDLAALLLDVDRILQRTIGEDILLVTRVDEDLPAVVADPGEIQQVLLDLALFARDTMPQGGRLRIRAGRARLDMVDAHRHGVLEAGDYALVEVADSGSGLDAEARSRIFEPFSEPRGDQGAGGLGLSIAYSIVKRLGGDIVVESAPRRGTSFFVYLPAQKGPPRAPALTSLAERSLQGTEHVLVAEDAALVRSLIQAILEGYGYTTVGAMDGEEALALLEQADPPIDLVIADVVMPRTNGPELARRAHALRPDLPVLFISGYRDHPALAGAASTAPSAFLAKPFAPVELARKVREVLGSPKTPG